MTRYRDALAMTAAAMLLVTVAPVAAQSPSATKAGGLPQATCDAPGDAIGVASSMSRSQQRR
jgi:hypothetical protein